MREGRSGKRSGGRDRERKIGKRGEKGCGWNKKVGRDRKRKEERNRRIEEVIGNGG